MNFNIRFEADDVTIGDVVMNCTYEVWSFTNANGEEVIVRHILVSNMLTPVKKTDKVNWRDEGF